MYTCYGEVMAPVIVPHTSRKQPLLSPLANTANITPTTSHSDPEMIFVIALVKSILGRNLKDIPDDKKNLVIENCLSIYHNYLVSFFCNNFSPRDGAKLTQIIYSKTSFSSTSNIHNFDAKFQTAYKAFLKHLTT
jgi:hypothetical protein